MQISTLLSITAAACMERGIQGMSASKARSVDPENFS